MKTVECRACGSRELVEDGGVMVCAYCLTRYVPEVGSPLVQPVCAVGPCEEPTAPNSRYCGDHSDMKIVRKKKRPNHL